MYNDDKDLEDILNGLENDEDFFKLLDKLVNDKEVLYE